jgi:predicted Zn-dependent protease
MRWKYAGFRAAIVATAIICFISPASAEDASVFEAIRALDAEMASIAYRLTTSNAPLCGQQEPSLGLLLHTPDQYALETRAAAIRHFRFDGPAGVEAALPQSPAALAGIKQDDTVIGVNNARFSPANMQGDASTNALIAIYRQIMALPPAAPLTLHIRRDGAELDHTVTPVPACRSRFELVVDDSFLAQADGELVQISSRFLTDYPQWAAAPIAHELAHNILRHRERLEAKGVSYGLLSGIGRNVGYFRQTELEADILSISLLFNAGYDPKIAILFWRNFGPSRAGGILRSRTHPSWKTRVAVMEHAISELNRERFVRPTIIEARDRPLDGEWQTLLPPAD